MRRFSYECRCGKEFDKFIEPGIPVPQKKRCECGAYGTRVFKVPQTYPDAGVLRLSSLLPLNYTHATRGKVDAVEGNAGLREHLHRYNGTYNRGLEV